MGAWGIGIFSSDTAEDVRYDYLSALKAGRTDQEVEDYAIQYYSKNNDEDDCDLWTALAITQWKYGRLSEKVKNRAIQIIDNGGNCDLYEGSDKAKREKVLLQCKQTLLSLMPDRKIVKLVKPKPLSPWKMGDVFAYQISDKYPSNKAFFGKYFIFIITDVECLSKPFKELDTDWLFAVVLNKVFDNVPFMEDLNGIGYLHFHNKPEIVGIDGVVNHHQVYRNYCIPLECLGSERQLKKFMTHTIPIGNNDKISKMRATIYSCRTHIERLEENLVELYQDKELNVAV